MWYIDESKRLYACSDASKDGYGFIIFQLTREDDPIVWWYFCRSGSCEASSRKLLAINSGSFNKEQRIWSTTDQECYAIYKGIMDDQHLLFDRLYSASTDHKNLTFLVDRVQQ